MPFRCSSIRKTHRVPGPVLPALVALLVATGSAQAFTILPDPASDAQVLAQAGYDLYLAVSINGVSRDMVAVVRQEADGSLAMAPDEVKRCGLVVPTPLAPLPDGKIALSNLPNVTYSYDAAQQAIIIMDDVVANGGRFMSAQTPYSLDIARDTLGQLARLHATTWGCEQVADLAWLSARVTPMADIFPLDQLQLLLDDGRGPDVAPELRSAANVAEAMRQLCRAITGRSVQSADVKNTNAIFSLFKGKKRA